jgi:hypothetical protein
MQDPPVTRLALGPPTPDPGFEEGVHFRVDLPASVWARLWVVDVTGRVVRTLRNGNLAAGRHLYDLANRRGPDASLPGGVYTIVLEASGKRFT